MANAELSTQVATLTIVNPVAEPQAHDDDAERFPPAPRPGNLETARIAELERALVDHELIKVEIRSEDREERAETIAELCKAGRAELVQTIGKKALIYRKNPQPNKQLSNIHRYK